MLKIEHLEGGGYNIDSIINSMIINNVILFDYFTEICNQLDVKIRIE